tara:strand:+ start:132 stop:428 length:297 start_codon:yes stop_codon:yes gene_type:complete
MISLIYNELVQNFNKLLTSTSRGFDTEHEFLESWVPNEEINQSIIDLITSANEYDVTELNIKLSEEELNLINLEKIHEKHQKLGIFKLTGNTLVYQKH